MSTLTPRIDRLDTNLIINGDMRYWQRATTKTTNGPAIPDTVDRFSVRGNIIVNATYSQSGDVPTLTQARYAFPYSYNFQAATTTTNLTAGVNRGLSQTIEGTMINGWLNKNVTISFWVKAKLPGTYRVAFYRLLPNSEYRNYDYTISAADTWQKVVFKTDTNFASPSLSSVGSLELFWYIASGDGFAPNNFWTSTNNYFRITGVQITKEWSDDPDFCLAGRDPAEELRLCQRYFHKWSGCHIATGAYNGGGGLRVNMIYPVKMRAAPTISSNGTFLTDRYYEVYSLGASGTLSSESFYGVNADQFLWETGFSVGPGANSAGRIIIQNNGYIQADAEL